MVVGGRNACARLSALAFHKTCQAPQVFQVSALSVLCAAVRELSGVGFVQGQQVESLTDERLNCVSGHLEGIGVRNFIQPLLLKTECSSSTCAWRSPRALTGFLASTPQSSQGECALWSKLGSRNLTHRSSVSPQININLQLL